MNGFDTDDSRARRLDRWIGRHHWLVCTTLLCLFIVGVLVIQLIQVLRWGAP